MEHNDITLIFNYKFLLSLPSRLLQLLILIITGRLYICFDDNILKAKWKDLATQFKRILISIMSIMIIAIFLISNDSDVYVKVNQPIVTSDILMPNIQMNFFGTVIFMTIAIYLFIISSRYIEYRKIVMKTPQELCRDLGEVSSPDQIKVLMSILKEKLISKEVKQNEKYS
jgi:hypothetical protein